MPLLVAWAATGCSGGIELTGGALPDGTPDAEPHDAADDSRVEDARLVEDGREDADARGREDAREDAAAPDVVCADEGAEHVPDDRAAWLLRATSAEETWTSGAAVRGDGNIVTMGFFGPSASDDFHKHGGWMLVLDPAGRVVERGRADSIRAPWRHGVQAMPDGGLLFSGIWGARGYGPGDVWVARTDRDGTMLWGKTLDGPGSERDPAVAIDGDGRIFMVAVSMCIGEGRDLWIAGLRADGTIDWQLGVGALGNADGPSIAAGPDGRVYVAAGRKSDDPYAGYVWLAAIEPGGVVAWQRDLVGSGENVARVEVADDDGLLLVGTAHDSSPAYLAAWVVRMTLSGELLWQRGYSTGDHGNGGGGAIATADGYLVVGHGQWWSSYAEPLWLGRLDRDGNVLETRFLETNGYREVPDFVLKAGEVILVGRDRDGALVGRAATESVSPGDCGLQSGTPLELGVVDAELRGGFAVPYSTDGTAMDSAVAFHAAEVCVETLCPE